jgi:hypothetical protein
MAIKKLPMFVTIILTLVLLTSFSFAASYSYSLGFVWHSVEAKSGAYFNVTTSNPSISDFNQSLYKGGSLGVEYALVNSSGTKVKTMKKTGAYSGTYEYFGSTTSGSYKLRMTNLYDDDNTAFTGSGTFNY